MWLYLTCLERSVTNGDLVWLIQHGIFSANSQFAISLLQIININSVKIYEHKNVINVCIIVTEVTFY